MRKMLILLLVALLHRLDRALSRLTAAGAIYLVLVCLLPEFMITGFKVQPIPLIGCRERLGGLLKYYHREAA